MKTTETDLDEPFVHPRPLTGAAAAIFGMAYTLADIEQRRAEAQRIAQHAADANEGKDWNAESLQGEYDVDSEGDEN